MKGKDKDKNKNKILVLAITCFAVFLFISAIVVPVIGAEAEVTRFSPTAPAPDAEFDVTLRISGELPLVAGIVETIPEGFVFKGTTHPSDQYKVSGRKVAFAVINETEIKYTVKAPSSGKGTFKGEFVDLLVLSPELEEGKERWETIADTIVIVGGEEAKSTPRPAVTPAAAPAITPTPKPTTPPAPASEVPGFEAIFAVVSLIIACLFIFGKKGKRR
ncbi:hypothetical protein KAW18_12635 [candidate division WOR-3 bacterium]|nr:hypothetical protein [candidate division WOR-3 bacterium]